jgi:hypothetical protein
MSAKPNPVALTAAMLMNREWNNAAIDKLMPLGPMDGNIRHLSSLASQLHRLSPACQRHAVAMCNGEWRVGDRDSICRVWLEGKERCDALRNIEDSIEKYGTRLDKRLAKLNDSLAPLAIQACRHGDPRGCVLRLVSTDATRPLPSNGGTAGEWCL